MRYDAWVQVHGRLVVAPSGFTRSLLFRLDLALVVLDHFDVEITRSAFFLLEVYVGLLLLLCL